MNAFFDDLIEVVSKSLPSGKLTPQERIDARRLLARYDGTSVSEAREALTAVLARSREDAELIRRLFDEQYPAPNPNVATPPRRCPRKFAVAVGITVAVVVGLVLAVDHWPQKRDETSDADALVPIPTEDVRPISKSDADAEANAPAPQPPLIEQTPPPSCVGREYDDVTSPPNAAWFGAPVGLIVALLVSLWGLSRSSRRAAVPLRPGPRDYAPALPGVAPEQLDGPSLEALARVLEIANGEHIPSKQIDVRRSVGSFARTLDPTPIFRPRPVRDRLLVLRDTSASMRAWQWRIDGFLDNVRKQGVVIDIAYFHHDIERPSWKPMGAPTSLSDLRRKGAAPLLIITTGEQLSSEEKIRRLRRALRRWPTRMVLHPDDEVPGFLLSHHPARFGLPAFGMSPASLGRARDWLLGATARPSPARGGELPGKTRLNAVVLRGMVSLFPRWSWPLAETLRREFFPSSSPRITAMAHALPATRSEIDKTRSMLQEWLQARPKERDRLKALHSQWVAAPATDTVAWLRYARDRVIFETSIATEPVQVGSDELAPWLAGLAHTPFGQDLEQHLETTMRQRDRPLKKALGGLRFRNGGIRRRVAAIALGVMTGIVSWAACAAILLWTGLATESIYGAGRKRLWREADAWSVLCHHYTIGDVLALEDRVYVLAFTSNPYGATATTPDGKSRFLKSGIRVIELGRGSPRTYALESVSVASTDLPSTAGDPWFVRPERSALRYDNGTLEIFVVSMTTGGRYIGERILLKQPIDDLRGNVLEERGRSLLFGGEDWGHYPRFLADGRIEHSTADGRVVVNDQVGAAQDARFSMAERATAIAAHSGGFGVISWTDGSLLSTEKTFARLAALRPKVDPPIIPPTCAPLTKCGEVCVDLSKDVANCGQCAAKCKAGEACTNGTCGCSPGTVACDNKVSLTTCVDLQTDSANCGVCGKACAPDDACVGGRCVRCAGVGLTPCGGRCVNTSTDDKNCGTCGAKCSTDSRSGTCVDGVCTTGACKAPFRSCSVNKPCGTNTETDLANCGDCGKACRALPNVTAPLCSQGNCSFTSCVAGFGDCDRRPETGCETPLNTASDCGACGNRCGGSTSVCCNNACIDTSKDRMNCGSCGRACPTFVSDGSTACVDGQCKITCLRNGTTACGDACVDTSNDSKNCGGCGRACPRATRCQKGGCVKCGSDDCMREFMECDLICSKSTNQSGTCMYDCQRARDACRLACQASN